MPNIEVYGIYNEEHKKDLLFKIKQLLRETPYETKTVVTIINSEVTSLSGDSKPFLRLSNVCYEGELIEMLRSLNLDLEISSLNKFIEAV